MHPARAKERATGASYAGETTSLETVRTILREKERDTKRVMVKEKEKESTNSAFYKTLHTVLVSTTAEPGQATKLGDR